MVLREVPLRFRFETTFEKGGAKFRFETTFEKGGAKFRFE